MMEALVAVDSNWGIGYKGNLLFRLKGDMTNFRLLTENNIVVMGRKTLESLPGSKCLKNRINIVMSHDISLNIPGGLVCNSITQLNNEIAKNINKKVYIIGGQNIYEQLISSCSSAYVTKIRSQSKADRFFPNLDILSEWEMVYESDVKDDNGLKYTFTKYVNHIV